MAVRIEGLEDTLRFFDKQPENAKRIVEKSMKAGAKAGAKDLKKQLPLRFRKLAKSKSGIDARNEIWCRFGLYNNQVSQGHQPKTYRDSGPDGQPKKGITDWFKFYWRNYGTLTYRDRTHKFVRGIRKNVNRRNNVGQMATNEYDRAVVSAKRSFTEAFESAVMKNKDELLKR